VAGTRVFADPVDLFFGIDKLCLNLFCTLFCINYAILVLLLFEVIIDYFKLSYWTGSVFIREKPAPDKLR